MPILSSRTLARSGLVGLAMLLVAPSAATARVGVGASQAPVLVERFPGKAVDHLLWAPVVDGDGPGIKVRSGQLVVTIPAESAPATIGGFFGVGLLSRCASTGDLDAQVAYSLPTWPPSNGVRVALRLVSSGDALSSGDQVERVSLGATDYPGEPREVYLTHFSAEGQPEGFTGTNALSGKLRIVRTGDRLTGYYWRDGQWVLVHAGPGSTGAVSVAIAVWSSQGSFSGQPVRIAFKNFMVDKGQLDCTQIFVRRLGGNYTFSRRRAKVKAGTRVIWENDSGTVQTVTSDTRGWKFAKTLRRGTRASFVFTTPGTYQYYSKVNPGMKGRIVVLGVAPARALELRSQRAAWNQDQDL